jgi:Zn-dependent protease with chaperone function
MQLHTFAASLFDGTSPVARSVQLDVLGRELLLWSADETEPRTLLGRAHVNAVRVSEPLAHAPRLLLWPDGKTVEVPTAPALTAALGEVGAPPSLVVRLQRAWPLTVAALGVLLVLLVVAYQHGIPLLARWAAFAVPAGVEQRIGAKLLQVLDERHFQPSEVAAFKRNQFAARFAVAAERAAPGVAYRLEFRASQGGSGFNAFALPGGTIVLLDGLVERADVTQIIGVLGHELGHVAHKHSLRNVLQAAGVGALAGLIWGDFAGVASNVPLALGVLSYSRDFEREADDFAVELLAANELPVQPLIDFFGLVSTIERGISVPNFLSSHPSTPERIERLKRGRKGT